MPVPRTSRESRACAGPTTRRTPVSLPPNPTPAGRQAEDVASSDAAVGAETAEASGDRTPRGVQDNGPPFAPAEPTDGRSVGAWRTRYTDPVPRRQMNREGGYLLGAVCAAAGLLVAIALEWPRPAIGIPPERWRHLAIYGYAWAGGGLGGALFSAKWLIHTIGRGTWHQDRLFWRLFTPWLGAGAGLLVVLLSTSRVVPLFDRDFVATGPGATGIALLVGFFADKTFSRLEGFAAQHLQSSPKQAAAEPQE